MGQSTDGAVNCSHVGGVRSDDEATWRQPCRAFVIEGFEIAAPVHPCMEFVGRTNPVNDGQPREQAHRRRVASPTVFD